MTGHGKVGRSGKKGRGSASRNRKIVGVVRTCQFDVDVLKFSFGTDQVFESSQIQITRYSQSESRIGFGGFDVGLNVQGLLSRRCLKPQIGFGGEIKNGGGRDRIGGQRSLTRRHGSVYFAFGDAAERHFSLNGGVNCRMRSDEFGDVNALRGGGKCCRKRFEHGFVVEFDIGNRKRLYVHGKRQFGHRKGLKQRFGKKRV